MWRPNTVFSSRVSASNATSMPSANLRPVARRASATRADSSPNSASAACTMLAASSLAGDRNIGVNAALYALMLILCNRDGDACAAASNRLQQR